MNSGNDTTRRILERFIVFEGIDGTGTTTQLELLSKTLAREGVPFFVTAEPTDSALGRIIRRVLSGELPFSPETLAFLYASDRNEHIFGTGGIKEHLRSGELVICDRYLFSSLAYQGASCGPELPERLNKYFPLPSLLIFFELSPEISLKRITNRGTPDIFERQEILQRVSSSYAQIIDRFEREGIKVLRIDASLPIPSIANAIHDAVLSL